MTSHPRALAAILNILAVSLALTATAAWGQGRFEDFDQIPYTPFRDMQAVDADGLGTWQVPIPGGSFDPGYKLRGVVLNDPMDMLDMTPNHIPSGPGTMWQLGGTWQVFIESVSLPGDAAEHPELIGDFGGAAVWMGQNYGNHIWHHPDGPFFSGTYADSTAYSYTDADWGLVADGPTAGEMGRLNWPLDARTGLPVTEPLRAGDLIEVRARGGLFYSGKFNANEEHDNDPRFDFDIVLLDRDLPLVPTEISIPDVKDPGDAFLFDPTRQSGAEYYQARLAAGTNPASGCGAASTPGG